MRMPGRTRPPQQYLLTLSGEDAAWLERRLGGRLIIGPAGDIHAGVPVASLDAVTEVEAAAIRASLASWRAKAIQ